MSDQQPGERFDEDAIGGTGSAVSSDQVEADPLPAEPMGLPFVDSDVTDESLADRAAREVPDDGTAVRSDADRTWDEGRADDDEAFDHVVDIADGGWHLVEPE